MVRTHYQLQYIKLKRVELDSWETGTAVSATLCAATRSVWEQQWNGLLDAIIFLRSEILPVAFSTLKP
jgi:hypothetical protein